jgi:hypothetical protein
MNHLLPIPIFKVLVPGLPKRYYDYSKVNAFYPTTFEKLIEI